MAINNKENENLLGNKVTNKLDSNISVLQTINNPVNCSEIITSTQGQYSKSTSTISMTKKHCVVPNLTNNADSFAKNP